MMLKPIAGKISYVKFLDYIDDKFFAEHKITEHNDSFVTCYDGNHNVIAFYDAVNKEMWAIR